MLKIRKENFDLKLNVIVIIIAIFIALLILEILLRFFNYYGLRECHISGIEFVDNKNLSWRMAPNNTIVYDSIYYKINNKGWRDANHQYSKARDTFRIITIGDSVTFGYGVEFEHIYSKILEKKLKQDNELENNFEFIQIAMEDLCTEQQAYLAEIEGLKYDPDLIIIGYVLNDPVCSDLKREHKAWSKKPFIEKAIYKLKKELRKSSVIYYGYFTLKSLITNLENIIFKENKDLVEYVDSFSNIHSNSIYWDSVIRGFEKLQKISLRTDVPVILIIFPLLYDFEEYPWVEVHNKIAETALLYGIQPIDLLPYFQLHPENKLQVKNWDYIHPNILGHKIASDAIFSYLKANPELLIK